MTPLESLGEFGLIDRLRAFSTPPSADLVYGIGDDCAVYRVGDGKVHVISTDALVEGVHFDRAFTTMERLGFKAISVNVSDICAMNARPRFATIALGVPANMAVEDVEDLYAGVRRACERYRVQVVGGDVTAARSLLLSITVVGEAREEDVVYRSGAQVGDLICVTGDVGAAFAGLKLLMDAREKLRKDPAFRPDFGSFQYVLSRQLAPVACLEAVEAFSRHRVKPNALIDVSDGVASEIHHLCRQSNVGALLYEAALPIDPETRTVADVFETDVDLFALFGGEDYELLFTLPEAMAEKLPRHGLFSAIGRVVKPEEGIRIQTGEGHVMALEAGGFNHFGSDPTARDQS